VTIPDTNASVSYFIDQDATTPTSHYGNLTDGLQLFQVDGTARGAAVPEPTAMAVAAIGHGVVLAAAWLRRRRRVC
jgi:hypothetical protein